MSSKSEKQLFKCCGTDIDILARRIELSKRIIVISGAGISVSCGIADFRSKESGLYNTLDCEEIGIPCAELLFDLEYFLMDPAPFYRYARNLIPDALLPSPSHYFIKYLEGKKKLLRNYTQNIDGIEKICGINNVVECHGKMDKFRCTKCKKQKELIDVEVAVRVGEVCYCTCGEVLKPTITFFGERLPSIFDKKWAVDAEKCDLLIVMGTSLQAGSVHPLLEKLKPEVTKVYINMNSDHLPSKFSKYFDIVLLGPCDDIVRDVCNHFPGIKMGIDIAASTCAGSESFSKSDLSSSRLVNSVASSLTHRKKSFKRTAVAGAENVCSSNAANFSQKTKKRKAVSELQCDVLLQPQQASLSGENNALHNYSTRLNARTKILHTVR
jgi:NAD-dependent SIR2 family protein deacetylase